MAKRQVSVALLGPEGCGKTTALAKLCDLQGAFKAEEHSQCQDLAWELGRPAYRHGWMLDRLREERELGSTLVPGLQSFQSESCSYSAFDTPGREALAAKFLSAASLADVAVLVVSAAAGEWELAAESGRVKELALDSFTMGIKNVVVWVTKMDDFTVQFSQSRYDEIKKAVPAFLKDVGYKLKDVPVVPIAGLSGQNLNAKSTEMPWYAGHSALESLDALGEMNRPAEKPLRLPVLKVHDQPEAGPVVIGRVETGTIRPGIKVIFAPGGLVAEVKSVHKAGVKASDAREGEVVSVSLSGVEASELRKGMVISGSTDPASDAETFLAQVVVFEHPGQIRAGYCPAIAVHTTQVPCEFEELLSRVDRKTGKDAEAKPASARSGEVVTVKMRPRALVCVETFSSYPPLGRFAIRDHGRTIGVGVIKEVSKKAVPKRSESFDECVEKRKAPNSRRTISTHCTVGPNGKPSFTELFPLSHLEGPDGERYSLVAIKLHTGRTHQIRVHMLSIGHPLVTDAKYAEERLTTDRAWCPRNFLHTYRLAFRDLPTEKELASTGFGDVQELVTPLPADLRQAMEGLKPLDEVSRSHWQDWLAGEASMLKPFEKYTAEVAE
ncbi:unnamed protein product [Effrenium voratum]|uniref:Uncharacterized protein n=2 Tax=Effrenium voratum TaxID=2562239 RepID=A0AA36N761_9DINO|nr:unnamed protein product [Effrenium voratum]